MCELCAQNQARARNSFQIEIFQLARGAPFELLEKICMLNSSEYTMIMCYYAGVL